MKKIIAAFDGLDFSESTLSYAKYFAKCTNAHLVGIFLDDFTYHSYKFSDVLAYDGGVSDQRIKALDIDDRITRDKSVEYFRESCQDAKIKFSVHRDRNIAIQELLKETIYADMLVISNQERFNRFDNKTPGTFIQDMLSDVQCPVLVVPESFHSVDKVVLLYDGEPSSVYAIKMFSYLLPVLKSERIESITVKDKKETGLLPDNRLMHEFMKRHFPLADFMVLNGEPEEEILNYLRYQAANLLVVLGAYQRGRVSRWFRHSMADVLMNHLKVPLFTAHNK